MKNVVLPRGELEKGWKLSIENAKRLFEDGKKLYEQGRYPSAFYLVTVAIEEIGKALFLLEWARSEKKVTYKKMEKQHNGPH